MKYEPNENDTITRPGFSPIVITKLTKATAKFTYDGMNLTDPRDLFDTRLAQSIKDGAEVVRDGVRIVPPTSVEVFAPGMTAEQSKIIAEALGACAGDEIAEIGATVAQAAADTIIHGASKQTGIVDLISLATAAMRDNTSVLREILALKTKTT